MCSVGDPTSLTLRNHKLVYSANALVGLTTVTNVSFRYYVISLLLLAHGKENTAAEVAF
jgi:hypothetical protein